MLRRKKTPWWSLSGAYRWPCDRCVCSKPRCAYFPFPGSRPAGVSGWLHAGLCAEKRPPMSEFVYCLGLRPRATRPATFAHQSTCRDLSKLVWVFKHSKKDRRKMREVSQSIITFLSLSILILSISFLVYLCWFHLLLDINKSDLIYCTKIRIIRSHKVVTNEWTQR